jgi:DtxR family Mn-dependent transcriptional regulator
MDTWKEFEANELTHSAAHHLLAIHALGLAYGGWARVSDIARRLNITRGSVSINLRALKKRGWVETDEHHQVRLSEAGEHAAQAVMAKRVVVKAFLQDVLGLDEHQAEVDACKVEHLVSDATGRRLTHFLRFLRAGAPVTTDAITAFRSAGDECPESGTCELCHGRCLVAELARAM